MRSVPFAHGDRSVSAALFDALWDAPVGIALLDRELRFVRVNPTLARLNGRPIDQHIGRHLDEVSTHVAASVEPSLRAVIQTGEPATGMLLSDRREAPGREVRHWLANHYPIRTPSGQVIGVGIVVVEITDRKKTEERAEAARLQAEQAAEAQRSLRAEAEAETSVLQALVDHQRLIVGIVGHDLRTPLSAILSSAKLLARTEITERQGNLLSRVLSSAARMESIARDLLDFTRARSARGIPVTPRRVDMDDICRAAIEEAEASVPGCVIHYAREGDGRGEWDPDRLAQLLGNLLHNAITHGESGAPVGLRWRAGHGDVVLRVENRGTPIPAHAIPQIFEPFGQLAPSRGRRGGVGLGLFIAREIARAHGGSIDVTSGAAGTVVAARLPRSPGEAS